MKSRIAGAFGSGVNWCKKRTRYRRTCLAYVYGVWDDGRAFECGYEVDVVARRVGGLRTQRPPVSKIVAGCEEAVTTEEPLPF